MKLPHKKNKNKTKKNEKKKNETKTDNNKKPVIRTRNPSKM